MRKYTLLIFILAFASMRLNAEAPISTISHVDKNALVSVVEIRVSQFNDVTGCNLQFFYNPAIATAVSVAKNPLLPGLFNTYTATAGVVTIAWSTVFEATLPNDAVAFTITFNKVSGGTTPVSFNLDYDILEWGGRRGGKIVALNDKPLANYYFNGSLTWAVAPQTIAPHLTALPNAPINVPITVRQFRNIGSLSLDLRFDPDVLQYQSFTPNPNFPELLADLYSTGVVRASGFLGTPESGVTSGLYLNDDDVLITIQFNYLGGFTTLAWFDNGTSCEYADWPSIHVLPDTPQANFYIDGSVTELTQLELNIRVFLEGLFNPATGQLNKAQDFVGGVAVDKFAGTVADKITVELHPEANYGSPVWASTDVSLNQDGWASVQVPANLVGNHYLTVKNRNHLETASKVALPLDVVPFQYDFTTNANKAFGDNQTALGSGVVGLYAGDINDDELINITDLNSIIDRTRQNINGYLNEDINGDGIINITDINIVIGNIRQNINSITP